MIINHKHKFIFVHVPKCAGTSVARALYPYSDKYDTFLGCHPDAKEEIQKEDGFIICKHSKAGDIKTYTTPERWNEYFKFSFVRNPLKRIVSLYNWWHKTSGDFDPQKKEIICNLSFKEFVFSDYTGPSQLSYLTSKPTKDIFVADKNRIELYFIGRQESLHKDFAYICGLLDLPLLNLERHNESRSSKPYKDYHDKETRRETKKKYHEDFECFYPDHL